MSALVHAAAVVETPAGRARDEATPSHRRRHSWHRGRTLGSSHSRSTVMSRLRARTKNAGWVGGNQKRARGAAVAPLAASESESRGLGLLEWLGPVVPQGVLVTGVKAGWRAAWQAMVTELAPQSRDGDYERPRYTFDGVLSDDPGSEFPAVSGRYVVYVGNACPWCHRVTLTIALRGLESQVEVVKMIDDAERASRGGWVFESNAPDPVFNAADLREAYDAACPPLQAPYRGRCTAPFLVDRARRRAVNNESADICRMLNDVAMQPGGGRGKGDGADEGATGAVELRPGELIQEIDALNERTYKGLNNGVYRCGFATSQTAYERAAREVGLSKGARRGSPRVSSCLLVSTRVYTCLRVFRARVSLKAHDDRARDACRFGSLVQRWPQRSTRWTHGWRRLGLCAATK